jgi:hypothetical protein
MALTDGCKKHLKSMITNAQNHVDELISAVDANDPVTAAAALAAAEAAQDDIDAANLAIDLLNAKFTALLQKLDADAADSGGDSDFEAVISAITLP